MSNVYKLTQKSVSLNVRKNSKGSYLLGFLDPDEKFIPFYPGRSDTNVQNRLFNHVSSAFTHFRVFHVERVREAYHQECRHHL